MKGKIRNMKIAYYMPFKPMGHPNPSGDLVIGTELFRYFQSRDHEIVLASRLRCRWLYYRPLAWPKLFFERFRVVRKMRQLQPDVWLSYHSYYKGPDMLGPWCAARLGIPYVLFQGIYATKYRRRLTTRPGFYLNKKALQAADTVFTNKQIDEKNLLRLLPRDKVAFIRPGLKVDRYRFSETARDRLRASYQCSEEPVLLSAAMFRPGVKERGVHEVIRCCGELLAKGARFRLILVGDGAAREKLEQFAGKTLGDRVSFVGRVERQEMADYYSAADIFVFPGYDEAIGMVYLEAQSCGLPVVACSEWGGSRVVVDGETGLLSSADCPDDMVRNIETLLNSSDLRNQMSKDAAAHVEKNHDLAKNYLFMEERLQSLIDDHH
ncbi:MAG: glycosyltransferase family 4 protein [Thermodesulfobacteriota bacterium]